MNLLLTIENWLVLSNSWELSKKSIYDVDTAETKLNIQTVTKVFISHCNWAMAVHPRQNNDTLANTVGDLTISQMTVDGLDPPNVVHVADLVTKVPTATVAST